MSIKFRVAYLGNFGTGAPYSTENYIRRAFEQLGWEVVTLQENEVSTDDILCAAQQSDFLAITHTYGWNPHWRIGLSMEDLLMRLKSKGIPTVALHLDRYHGIPEREIMMRTHWFFRCAQVWTSDGGNQDKFAALGIDHHWFPPGIDQQHTYMGTPRPEYTADVCFVGARSYHNNEYPFRKEMVDWLADSPHPWSVIRFGSDRPTVRGPELNDIYASAKIVVGDSIFAGQPYYFSDRIPETIGRGGFLLHPKCEGMEFPMASYAPQSIADLEIQIEYWLARDNEREQLRRAGFEWFKNNGTWCHVILSLLNHLGFN
jgi:hypothetical protein